MDTIGRVYGYVIGVLYVLCFCFVLSLTLTAIPDFQSLGLWIMGMAQCNLNKYSNVTSRLSCKQASMLERFTIYPYLTHLHI